MFQRECIRIFNNLPLENISVVYVTGWSLYWGSYVFPFLYSEKDQGSVCGTNVECKYTNAICNINMCACSSMHYEDGEACLPSKCRLLISFSFIECLVSNCFVFKEWLVSNCFVFEECLFSNCFVFKECLVSNCFVFKECLVSNCFVFKECLFSNLFCF